MLHMLIYTNNNSVHIILLQMIVSKSCAYPKWRLTYKPKQTDFLLPFCYRARKVSKGRMAPPGAVDENPFQIQLQQI